MDPDFRVRALAADPARWERSSTSDEHPIGFHRLVVEAKEALGAVVTGEIVHFQTFATFADAADTSELRSELGVVLDEPSRRWLFEVSDASTTGFLGSARGREDTEAEGALVTVRYVRGETPIWTVRRRTASW